ncbi:MAG TPA: DUF2079 domain-containing protein [Streptosporangiaceae bacterium]|jgi:uncharacterized membrane protein|nr:DUF2079 domain-containing protein [Streptosporangiaceae bacterium]
MRENGVNDGGAEAPGTTHPSLPAEPEPEPGPESAPDLITARSGPRRSVWWAPWLIAGFVFAVYVALSVFRYLQFDPASWDLGIFTEEVKQYAHLHAPIVDIRGAGFNLLGDHFSPIVALIAPFFAIAPTPITLLVAQAALTAVSVLPVTWVAAEKLGRRPGLAIGTAYGLSWGLTQMIDFDFHEIAFALPLLAFSMSALIRGRYRSSVLWALPLVFVKEDQGFTVAALGAAMIVVSLWRDDPHKSVRGAMLGGQFLVVWGIVWSVLAIAVIIPHFNPAHHYQYWSDGGTLSPGSSFGVGASARQFFTAWPTKLQTTLLLLLPTAFIALWSPLALIALPSIVLRFLGTNSNFWGTLYHYNATAMVILFLAAVDAIARLRVTRGEDPFSENQKEGPGGGRMARPGPLTGWRTAVTTTIERHGAVAMLAIAVALIFQFPLSSLWQPGTYRLGSHQSDMRAAAARVPSGATVTTTLDLLAPLAARTDTFWIGNAGNPSTEYIVFDGTDSGYDPEPANIPAFVASQHRGAHYQVIFEAGDIWVFHRTVG